MTPRPPTPRPPTLRSEVLPADRERVRRLVAATGFFHAQEIEVAVELVDERLRLGPASGYHFLFAEHDGQVLGYACFGPIPCTKSGFDLYWIAVDPARQDQGLGRLLLAAVEQACLDMGGLRLYAETSSRDQYAPTRGFYEKNGFAVEVVQRDFYDQNDHKVVLRKDLA